MRIKNSNVLSCFSAAFDGKTDLEISYHSQSIENVQFLSTSI